LRDQIRSGTTLTRRPCRFNRTVADTLNGSAGDVETISNGERKTYLGIEIEAVLMYNFVLGPAPGKPFHHKGIGNGYILRFGTTRVYFSGDTECVPEMKVLLISQWPCRDEPSEDHAHGRGRRLHQGVPPEDCLPISLQPLVLDSYGSLIVV